MTDAEKIEQAAYEAAKNSGLKEMNQIYYAGFEKGAQWARKNPSPEVEALVDCVDEILDIGLDPEARKQMDGISYQPLAIALKNYRKTLEGKS